MDKKNLQPLGEVFGFPIENQSDRANRYRDNKLCPYNNIVSNCTKNSIEFPLGVCSLNYKGKQVIICPIRFREDWTIISDAANFIFDGKATWTHVGEVRLKDKHSKSAGNIDYVLVSYDDKGRVLDFGSLEVQAVYISGNLTGPFTTYLENPTPDFSWTPAFKFPKPDYLSSSRKRLIPQIIAKGSILKQWNKKQVVALQTGFYNTLPALPEFDKAESDFAFFLYDLVHHKKTKVLSLKLQRVVYTKFASALEHIAKFEAGSINQFTEILQKKLDAKRAGTSDIENIENIVVE
ncbi:NotI family restriction endonuclease [Foetidibacter luteolus]|uniref:NotI family restriction endonuclease n=1 Tax=Foetidibacter luteolus TaxID=2608880 RepID=UPI00129B14AD|nr:NotI family restriction endonuclease [Foetidibacter luteolus]